MNCRSRPSQPGRPGSWRVAFAALALVFICAACGQRGPLYLPEPPAGESAQSTASSTEADQEGEPDAGDAED